MPDDEGKTNKQKAKKKNNNNSNKKRLLYPLAFPLLVEKFLQILSNFFLKLK